MEYKYKTLPAAEEIGDAWERWEDYRNNLTENILTVMPFCNNTKIAVYGAGRCNDIDVNRLLSAGYQVTLLDVDIDAVKAAAEEKGYLKQITIQKIDLFEILDGEYERLEELAGRGAGKAEVAELLMEILNREGEKPLSVPSDEYGLNICVGLHSQVLVKLVSLMQLYGYQDASGQIHKLICEINDYMVERFHDELFQKGHGDIILGYEYGAFAPGKAKVMKDLFETGQADRAAEYQISRVAGAYEAEQDLNRRFLEGRVQIIGYRYDIWRFIQEKEYLMVFFIIGAETISP